MEAKDTVMPLEYSALDGLNCAGISDEKILRAIKAQAEISFRAGIREVVEWIEKHEMYMAFHCKEDWQAKLKEWGVK